MPSLKAHLILRTLAQNQNRGLESRCTNFYMPRKRKPQREDPCFCRNTGFPRICSLCGVLFCPVWPIRLPNFARNRRAEATNFNLFYFQYKFLEIFCFLTEYQLSLADKIAETHFFAKRKRQNAVFLPKIIVARYAFVVEFAEIFCDSQSRTAGLRAGGARFRGLRVYNFRFGF